jgi:hypothetical protein
LDFTHLEPTTATNLIVFIPGIEIQESKNNIELVESIDTIGCQIAAPTAQSVRRGDLSERQAQNPPQRALEWARAGRGGYQLK